jgi:UDP-GlcNAc3NAcA epimerase
MDSILSYQTKAKQTSEVLAKHQLTPNEFYLATIHRPSNTDDKKRLSTILDSLTKLDFPVVFPIHPRTQAQIQKMGLSHYLNTNSILAIPPVSYLDMLMLESACKAVITDSGGIQKEAYILGRPCLTLRNETEWKETVEVGWNQLVQPETLCQAIANFTPPSEAPALYGEGDASAKIAEIICSSSK